MTHISSRKLNKNLGFWFQKFRSDVQNPDLAENLSVTNPLMGRPTLKPPTSPLLAAPNVTFHPSKASVPSSCCSMWYYSMWYYNYFCTISG